MTAATDSVVAALNALGPRLWRSEPASLESVAELEQALAVRLPPSYVAFLRTFGAAGLVNSTISGIVDNKPLLRAGGSMFNDTELLRTEHGLPLEYLVIQPDDEAPYCLNTAASAKDGELPVVCYELYSHAKTRIASSFAEWVSKFFLYSSDDA